jgi:hypothetical protein
LKQSRRKTAESVSPDELKVAADTAWTLLTGFLVFFMNAGFGLVEAGLCRKKNVAYSDAEQLESGASPEAVLPPVAPVG